MPLCAVNDGAEPALLSSGLWKADVVLDAVVVGVEPPYIDGACGIDGYVGTEADKPDGSGDE